MVGHFLVLFCLLVSLCGCGSGEFDEIAHDLSTPEGAILTLEDAYRNRDIEAAIRCKDFTVEAKLMLERIKPEFSDDDDLISKTAEVLELGFRSEMKENGFPDFRGITSTFSDKQRYAGREDFVQLTEHCRSDDGHTTTNRMIVAKTADGWKVITVPE